MGVLGKLHLQNFNFEESMVNSVVRRRSELSKRSFRSSRVCPGLRCARAKRPDYAAVTVHALAGSPDLISAVEQKQDDVGPDSRARLLTGLERSEQALERGTTRSGR